MWKIVKEMGIQDHLTCLLRPLHAGHEATVKNGHETTDLLQIGKVCQGCILSPCLFNIHAQYFMQNARLDEAQVNVFLEFPCFLYSPVNVGNLISGPSALSKPSLYIWKFLVHALLKPSLKDFEHNLTSM